jgi:hypothetical protein
MWPSLHLNSTQLPLPLPLKHEVHFMPRGSAPVIQRRAGYVPIAPGEQIAEHAIFEMRPRWFSFATGLTEVRGQSRIVGFTT